jgi:asparaginyl-tRNA synthetase
LSFAIHKFFQDKGFYYVHTPLITSSDAEGAGEQFSVTTMTKSRVSEIPTLPDKDHIDYSKDFFSKPAYLTVSGQLHGEAYACGLGKIYTFGPTFRAEPAHTMRHLSEFWMIEPEVAFMDLALLMDFSEGMLIR